MSAVKRHHSPVDGDRVYRQMWRVVEGAVADAFNCHPDYLTPKGTRQVSSSVTKRVVGAVLSYATQVAKGRSGARPAPDTAGAGLCSTGSAVLPATQPKEGALYHAPSAPFLYKEIVRYSAHGLAFLRPKGGQRTGCVVRTPRDPAYVLVLWHGLKTPYRYHASFIERVYQPLAEPNTEAEKREATVMALINEGRTYQDVADALGLTRCTVSGLVYRAKKRMRRATP